MTGDGRLIETNALDLPVPNPLRFVLEDVGQHDGAQVVGTIEKLERRKGGVIWGEGSFDLESRVGREAARQVLDERTNGISMDMDSVAFEIRIAGELAEQYAEFFAPEAPCDHENEDAPEPELETDNEGRIIVAKVDPNEEVQVTTSARVRAATLVAIPAFADARIKADMGSLEDIEDSSATSGAGSEEGESLAAGGAATQPQLPPAAWFSDPRLTAPTALEVTEDGQVRGHLALWGTCHIAHSGSGGCVTPPHSAAGYSYFHTGAVRTAQGSDVAVGHITLDTGHANATSSPALTLAHYENTGTVVADVVAGEDSHGIWVAGAVRNLQPDQLRALRSAPLSGDWRRIGNQLELVAALAVNVPGFPVPRMSGLVAGGHVQSLVAAGMVTHRHLPATTVSQLSTDDLKYLRRLLQRERSSEVSQMTTAAARAFALRVQGSSLAVRARRTLVSTTTTEG